MVRHEDAVAARSAIFGSPNKRNTILYSPVPQASRLPDRAHDVCRFEFLSAFEILTVDFSPQFRYAVLALSVSFCTVNVKAKDQSCKAFWLNNSGLFVGACATAPLDGGTESPLRLRRCPPFHKGG